MTSPLWERLLVAGIGPLIAVILGGVLLERWNRKHQASVRLQERLHQQSTRQAEERRQIELRVALVSDLTRAGTGLEMALRMYRGELRRADKDAARLDALRSRLDDAYRFCRVEGALVERRLRAHFADDRAANAWHRADDLLTVLYWRRIGLATEKLYEANKGPDHSGLDVQQLSGHDTEIIWAAYRAALADASAAALEGPLRLPSWDPNERSSLGRP